jgi:hypothetical protein
MKIIFLIFIYLFSSNAMSNEKDKEHEEHKHEHEKHAEHDDDGDDHDDHGASKAIGKGKAIESVDEVKGFQLSKEAIKTLELKLKTVEGPRFIIDKSTLVTSINKKGIYRFRAGFFKFLPVKIIKEFNGKFTVDVKGVGLGDQIVINGTGLLRIADVYSTDKSSYGHAH